MAGKSSSYRLCLSFSTAGIYDAFRTVSYENLWYLIDPFDAKEVVEKGVETKCFEEANETQRLISPTSKFFAIGGYSWGATRWERRTPYI
ncbi:hypothetical protein FRX31_004770 [Thalictrum thalictroides]|uniref:Uncharacterized protein n=1 Tax=Thalictrum thalictroides TaxID=46969 RepID=A0A7J6X8B5_THATH|nr:hypothetical protein FRX31_004770 [Thalictrum thalictroides]